VSVGRFLDQQRARQILERGLTTGQLPSSFLFTGPRGVGKEEAALAFAKALNCRSSATDGADLFATIPGPVDVSEAGNARLGGCGVCASCSRIDRYVHPDVLVRLPLPKEKNSRPEDPSDPTEALAFKAENPWRDPQLTGGNLEIRVGDVRAIVRELAYAPVEGARRIVIFREADRMNHAAQNALLKSLEEPPAHTLFVLTTHQPEALLPTVRSRCRRVPFGPLPAEVIATWLAENRIESKTGIDPAAMARGSLKRAIGIAEEGVPGRAQALQILTWAVDGNRRDALAWAGEYVFKSGGGAWTEARQILEEVVSLTRDLAALESGERASLHNPDQADLLRRIARGSPPGTGLSALQAAVVARGEVDRNINLALIYSTLSVALSPPGA
jgi:DNA polymerase-3 subunit delta'